MGEAYGSAVSIIDRGMARLMGGRRIPSLLGQQFNHAIMRTSSTERRLSDNKPTGQGQPLSFRQRLMWRTLMPSENER